MKTPEQTETSRQKYLAEHIEALGPADPAHVAVGSTSFYQAQHASYVCLDMVSRHLLENEAILYHPDLYRLADEAHEALSALYQKFGEKIVTEN